MAYPDAGHYVLEDAHRKRLVPAVRRFLDAGAVSEPPCNIAAALTQERCWTAA